MIEPIATPESQQWLRPGLLRSWSEFLLVAALLIAIPVRSSTLGALRGSSHVFIELLLTNSHLLQSLFWEALLLALFLAFLHWRGWRPADFKIDLGWDTSGQAVALLILAWALAITVILLLINLVFQLQTTHASFVSFLVAISPKFHDGAIHFNWPLMAVAMVVNAYLEELIFMGYIFNQIAARRGPAVALPVTLFLRVACHTYQDPIHLAGIAILFATFAFWYWVGRSLWPLILAHILLDIISCTLVEAVSELHQHLHAPGF